MPEPGAQRRGWRRWGTPVINIACVLVLLGAVSVLPPDTALQEAEQTGALRACVPRDYPPLVIAGNERAGIEIDLLRAAAARMDLRLVTNTSAAMGRDINPRNWRLTRAQCNVIAGGVVTSQTTRSYLDTSIAHLEVGWVALDAGYQGDLSGARVGVFPGFSGFDRIALSQFLRGRGAEIALYRSQQELARAIEADEVDLGVTESLGGRQIAQIRDLRVRWLAQSLERLPVAFGLWKGDLTLKRALNAALEEVQEAGGLETLLDRYALQEIAGTFIKDAPDARNLTTERL